MKHTKYPKTYHLPISKEVKNDDKTLKDYSNFEGNEVVVTVKMDGENTTLYHDGLHARSLNSKHNWTRDWLVAWYMSIKYFLPSDIALNVEYMYAKHSIEYNDLDHYVYILNAWKQYSNGIFFLSWDEVHELSERFEIPTPRVLYKGVWDEKKIKEIANTFDTTANEGFVVRNINSFPYDEFSKNVGKFVREGHVQTSDHWLKNTYKNKLKNDL